MRPTITNLVNNMDRYEKALELARAYYDKDANAFLDTIFPELKEIRDEQIRKAIIKSLDLPFMEAKIDGTDVTYEEAVSWLEKQKEQKQEWSENFEEAVTDLIERAKQGKCDSLSATEEAFKLLAIIKHGKVNQQKWSEEDEDMRDTIIRDLKRLGGDLVKVNPAYKEEINWLKLLPKRFILQPKAELSKEDEFSILAHHFFELGLNTRKED